MSRILTCCQNYNNLVPCSMRTSKGTWELIWKCEVCKSYARAEFNTNAGITVLMTNIEPVKPEELQSAACILEHDKLDKFQLKNVLSGVDIFYQEKDDVFSSEVYVPKSMVAELGCPNCLIDPTIETTDDDTMMTCVHCGSEYMLRVLDTPTSDGHKYELLNKVSKYTEPEVVEDIIEELETITEETVVDDTEDPMLEQEDDVVDDQVDASATFVYDEDPPTNIEIVSADDDTPKMVRRTTDMTRIIVTYDDCDTVLLGECMNGITMSRSKSYDVEASKLATKYIANVAMAYTDEHVNRYVISINQQELPSDKIVDIVLSEDTKAKLIRTGDKYIIPMFVINIQNPLDSYVSPKLMDGYILIEVSPVISFEITK